MNGFWTWCRMHIEGKILNQFIRNVREADRKKQTRKICSVYKNKLYIEFMYIIFERFKSNIYLSLNNMDCSCMLKTTIFGFKIKQFLQD